jgi:hypothetical protein
MQLGLGQIGLAKIHIEWYRRIPMNKKLNVAVALIAGLAGGMLTRYIAPPIVFAQTQNSAVTKEVRAQSFTLVDQYDNVAGTFTAESMGTVRKFTPGDGSTPQLQWQSGPMRIVLRDAHGRELWNAGGSNLRPLMATQH